MGAKRLKGVFFVGDRRRDLHDPEAVKSLAKRISEEFRGSPGVKAYKSMGTPQMVKVLNNANAFPTRYWQQGRFEGWEKISADALHQQCGVKPNACLSCMMACGRMTTVLNGRHAGLKIEGPEYETIYAFGGLCAIDQIEEIAYLNDICDRLTLFDTLILCRFYRDLCPWEVLQKMIHAVTGLEVNKNKLAKIASAVSTQVRQFNLREGLTVEDDRLSKGLYKSLADSGDQITEQELQQMIQDYYRLRGWDEAGRPMSD